MEKSTRSGLSFPAKMFRFVLALTLACLLVPVSGAYADESDAGQVQAVSENPAPTEVQPTEQVQAVSEQPAPAEAQPTEQVQAVSEQPTTTEAQPADDAEGAPDASLGARIVDDPASAGYTILNVIEPSEEPSIPVHVSTEAELRAIADAVNADTGGSNYAGYTVYLDNDIELTGAWTPIGTGGYNASYSYKEFAGIFDGQGHTISGLSIANTDSTASYNNQGLFGRVSGSVSNIDYSAGTADITKAIVKNVVVQGSVSTVKGKAAGLIAYSSWTDVIDCGNEANVTGGSVAGGIVGSDNFMVNIESCYNKGNITLTGGTAYDGVGGITGTFGAASSYTSEVPTISNCYNWGTITAKTTNAGGIVGGWYANSAATQKRGAMENCYNAGTIVKESLLETQVAGALVGMVRYYSSDNYQENHTATNNFSLEGRAENLFGIGGGLSVSGNSFMTQADMQAASFVTTLGAAYQTVDGSYPVLVWESDAPAAQLIGDATVGSIPALTYNGQAHTPEPTVTYDETPLTKGVDYTLSYQNNTDAGTATLSIEGIGSYTGSKQVTFTIDPRDIADASVAAIADQTYHAGGVVPAAVATVVLVEGQTPTTLQSGTDYTSTGVDNTAVGTGASVTLSGTGNYTGTVSAGFTIVACDINSLDIPAISDRSYLGSPVTPVPVITDGEYTLATPGDFTIVGYANNTAPASSTDTNAPSVSITGTGNYTGSATLTFTIKNPNIISTEAELIAFRDSVNTGTTYKDTTVLLADDIALSAAWTTPIGSAEHPFEGTFDGQGNTISDLQLTTNHSYTGLFGYSSGTIENLSVAGSVTSTVSDGGDESTEGDADYIGGVVGYNTGTLQRVSANVAVSGRYAYHVGGLAGRNAQGGLITECENLGYVLGYERVGGIVGSNYGTVSYCYNNGTTETESTYGPVGVGGIAGLNGSKDDLSLVGVIESCYNTGIVGIDPDYATVGGYQWKGGIAGYCNDASSVKNCYDTGLIVRSYRLFAPITGGIDYGYSYQNNYSLEGLSSSSTGEMVRGIVKTYDQMRSASFVDDLNGSAATPPYKAQADGFPLLYWQTSAAEPLRDLTIASVDAIDDLEVTGEALTPLPEVTYRGTALVKDVDYTLAYSDNVNVGTATITITGTGLYYGTISTTFNITPAGPKTLAISSEDDLAAFRDKVNGGFNYSGYTVTLENDIALTRNWTPIGLYTSTSSSTTRNGFAGIFDGQGHTVSNMNILNGDTGFNAFFGYVVGTPEVRAEVKNLTVDGSVTSVATSGNAFSSGGSAGVVGSGNNIIIENCANKASVSAVRCAGGIVSYLGYGHNDVIACHNYGDISSTSTAIVEDGSQNAVSGVYAGGIIAYFVGSSGGGNTIESCYNTGTVSSTATAGGIVGLWYPASSGLEPDKILLANCYNTGTVKKTVMITDASVTQYSYQGGIVGYVSDFASTANARYNPLQNSYYLDTSCDAMIGGGVVDGVTVDALSDTMSRADMEAPGFVTTLGDRYKPNAVSTPLLFWEASAIEGAVVSDIPEAMYTGEAIEPEVEVYFGDTHLEQGIDYTVEFKDNVNVGRATVIVTGINDYFGTVTESFVITPAPLTLTPKSIHKQPGTVDPVFTVAADGLKGSDEVSEYVVTRELGEEVGSYRLSIDEDSVVVKRGDAQVTGNYRITYATGLLTISDADLAFDIPTSATYTGSPIEPDVTVTSEGLALNEGTDYTLSYSNNVNAGSATAIVTGLGVYAGTFSVPFTIDRAPLNLAVVSAEKRVGAADPSFAVTPTGLVGDDGLASYTVVRDEGEHAGTYAATLDGASVVIESAERGAVTGNYVITTQAGELVIRGSVRYAGNNRIDTANQIVSDSFDSAEGVILATSEKYPDALAVSALAGALGYPVLLTPGDAMSSDVAAVVAKLGVGKVIIVGGESSVSAYVARQAAVYVGGPDNVVRLAGNDRFETAAKIHEYGTTAGDGGASVWKSGEVILASGMDFADALSISPYAAGDHVPILLTDDAGSVPAVESGILSSMNTVSATGGTVRVSAGTEQELKSVGKTFVRYAGADRYDTSSIIAKALVKDKGYTFNGAAFATGVKPYDALCGSVKQGMNRSVLMLVSDETMTAAGSVFRASGERIDELFYLGGTGSVSDAVRTYFDGIAGF